MKTLMQFCFHILRDLWLVIRPVRYVLVFLVLGFLILTVPDQSQDIFISFTENPLQKDLLVFAFIAVPLWAVAVWYSTRVVLQLTDVVTENKRENRIRLYIKWLPRFLGLFPYMAAMRGFTNVDANLAYPLFFVAMAGIYLTVVHYRRDILTLVLVRWLKLSDKTLYRWFPVIRWDDDVRFQRSIIGWKEFPKWTFAGAFFLWVLLFVLFTFSPAFARLVGAAAIIVLAIACWTLAGMLLSWLDYTFRFPFFISLLVMSLVFSLSNNNHAIRTLDTPQPVQRVADTTRLQQWVSRRDTTKQVIPLFIIAAEGGGIRSAYWTASVLAHLQQKYPDFYDHTFAVSGVSGGSLGVAAFSAVYKDVFLPQRDTVTLLRRTKEMLSQDFLSPLTAALLYPDLLQRFLPVAIPAADRARWLEDEWARAYRDVNGHNTLDASFLSLWQTADSLRMPWLLLNGTKVETGQKAIMSNVHLSQRFFRDAVDLQHVVGEHIALKTAASMSARFPVVTPPATIYSDGYKWGHVVDGGYFENTGLMTAMQVLHMIQTQVDLKKAQKKEARYEKLKPVIIYLKNAALPAAPPRALKVMYELQAPLGAFVNAWSRTGISTAHSVENAVERLDRRVEFITFELNYSNEELVPLGWFLSEKAQQHVDRQVRKIGDLSAEPANAIGRENRRAFRLVDELLRINKIENQ